MEITIHRTLTLLHVLLFGLAAWRMSSLIANELGPFYIFLRIRVWTGILEEHFVPVRWFHLSELMHCEWCSSVWFGFILVGLWLWLGNLFMALFVLPLAVSTVAIIVKYIVHCLQRDHVAPVTLDDVVEYDNEQEYQQGKEVTTHAV